MNDRQLHIRRLSCNMFTDTLEAAETSWHRRNKYAQVFARKLKQGAGRKITSAKARRSSGTTL